MTDVVMARGIPLVRDWSNLRRLDPIGGNRKTSKLRGRPKKNQQDAKKVKLDPGLLGLYTCLHPSLEFLYIYMYI